jgi:hypothetical protein
MPSTVAGLPTAADPLACEHPVVWMVDIASRRVVRAQCPLCASLVAEMPQDRAAAVHSRPSSSGETITGPE